MRLRNQDYTWPSSYSAGRYLRTDSQGNLTWEEVAGGSGSVNLSTLVFNDIVPVGTIMPWAGTSLPADNKWKFCDGSQVSSATYPQLAALLGIRYGSASSGKTRLPNLGGKVPLGANGTFSVGGTGGSSDSTVSISGTTGSTTLTADQSGLPRHKHPYKASHEQNGGKDKHGYFATDASGPIVTHNEDDVVSGAEHYYDTSVGNNLGLNAAQNAKRGHSHSFSGSTRISNYQPYVTTQYIIKVLPDDVQQVSITAGNGINVKDASNQDTTTLDLFSTSINVKANTNHFKFNSSGLLELKTPAVSQASITSQINNAIELNNTNKLQVKDGGITPSKLSTGAPNWDATGTLTVTNELNVGDEINLQGAADTDSLLQQNASSGRDELQIYASVDAYSSGSKGSGIHLYGNGDSEHSGGIAFLTGQDDQGDARMIISGGSRLPSSNGYRTNTDTRVTIGNDIFNYVDDEDDKALLTLKNPIGRPALYIEGASAAEGDIAIPVGEKLSIGVWDGTTFTPRIEVDSSGNFIISSIATSPTGLPSGAVYSDGGTLKIV